VRRIICTRKDRGVDVITPTAEVMAILTLGGKAWSHLSRDEEIGFFLADDKWHPQLSANRREQIATRWIDALMTGGKTDAEAYELIRDKDVTDGCTGVELWDFYDIPQDRWFRNAWTRSQNGGPIEIDMRRARVQHGQRLHNLEQILTKKVRKDRLVGRVSGYADRALYAMREDRFLSRLSMAETPEQLKSIWPIRSYYQ
jgi:hypothetical protein